MDNKSTTINTGLTVYDINKQGMDMFEPLDPIAFNKQTKEIAEAIYTHSSNYWLLLCRERNDYTLFIPLTIDGIQKELNECLNNRGYVLSIEKQSSVVYEIWIRDFDTKENFVYYLFDYSYGVCTA